MIPDAVDLVERGQRELARGDLAAAAELFRDAIDLEDLPLAYLLLGGLAYSDDRFDDARCQWEGAFRGFHAKGDLCGAARAAIYLVDLHTSAMGNAAAGRGWLARAKRLLTRVGPCVEWGYLALAVVACDVADIASVERNAESALATSIEFGDTDLEVRALADSGLAMVCAGRVEQGFARLDEAMAIITAGEVRELSVAGKSFCAMLTACDRTGDSRRAQEWTRLVAELTTNRLEGRPRVLYTHCRSVYGSVLCNLGRWPEAEAAMLDALASSSSVHHQALTCSHLADLCLQQGREEEAAEVLRPYEDRVEACGPLARLHMNRGEFDLAAAVVLKGLRMLVGDRLRKAPLLAQLVEIELKRKDQAAASDATEKLSVLAAGTDSPVLNAEAALARSRLLAARGEPLGAVACLEEAQRYLVGEERPVLCGMIRYELSRALCAAGNRPAAVTEGCAAMTVFERFGAPFYIDMTAALLRSLGVPARSRQRKSAGALSSLTPREFEVLGLVRQGLTNSEIGSRLFITAKTAEHHVCRVLTKLGARSRAEAAAMGALAAAENTAGTTDVRLGW